MLIMQVKLKSMHAYNHIANSIKFQNILPISKTLSDSAKSCLYNWRTNEVSTDIFIYFTSVLSM